VKGVEKNDSQEDGLLSVKVYSTSYTWSILVAFFKLEIITQIALVYYTIM